MNSEIEISDFEISWEVNEVIDYDEFSIVPNSVGRYWLKNPSPRIEVNNSSEAKIIYH